MKIWCLFSIANEYDQPNNNLISWWLEKPNIKELARVLHIKFDLSKGNSFLGKLLKEQRIKDNSCYTEYRLEQVEEGQILEEYD